MHLSIYILSLAITCNMLFCASSSELQAFDTFDVVQRKSKIGKKMTPQPEWTTNPAIADTVTYNIGATHNLCAYHLRSSEHTIYPWRQDESDHFGFAFLPSTEKVKPLKVSQQAFSDALAAKSNHFHVKESTSLHMPQLAAGVFSYAYSSPACPGRFVFLCPVDVLQERITTELNESKKIVTLAAATKYVYSLMPRTTFVLFDVFAYCENVLGVSRPDFTQKTRLLSNSL